MILYGYANFQGELPPELQHVKNLNAKEFIELCLKKNVEERPSASELLEHEFLRPNEQEDFMEVNWTASKQEGSDAAGDQLKAGAVITAVGNTNTNTKTAAGGDDEDDDEPLTEEGGGIVRGSNRDDPDDDNM